MQSRGADGSVRTPPCQGAAPEHQIRAVGYAVQSEKRTRGIENLETQPIKELVAAC